ncbi:MAG: hypothetical protein AAB794_00640 [Patescibacteria group bacterium]
MIHNRIQKVKRVMGIGLALLLVLSGIPIPFTQHQTWFGAGRVEAGVVM